MKKLIIASLMLFITLSSVLGCSDDNSSKSKYPQKPTNDIYVVDSAHMLDKKTTNEILKTSRDLDSKYGAQLVVVTVNSIGDDSIVDYANGLFREYGIGNKEKNNGVLLLIAKDQRKMRIEVGYGLEGQITDSRAGEILDKMKPYFKKSDYSGGTLAAFNELANDINKEYSETGNVQSTSSSSDSLQSYTEPNSNDVMSSDNKDNKKNVGFFEGLLLSFLALSLFSEILVVIVIILIIMFIISIFSGGGGSGGSYGGGSSFFGGGSSSGGSSSFGGGDSGSGGCDGGW